MHAAEAREKNLFSDVSEHRQNGYSIAFPFLFIQTTHKTVTGKYQEVTAAALTQDLPAPFCLELSKSNTHYLNDCFKKTKQKKTQKPLFYCICVYF